MIKIIFDQGVMALNWLAEMIGVSYEQANILVYFVCIPATWIFMIAVYYKIKPWIVNIAYFTIPLTVYVLGTDKMFEMGVQFEHWLSFMNWNYFEASVYTCVIFPIVVTLGLISINIKKKLAS